MRRRIVNHATCEPYPPKIIGVEWQLPSRDSSGRTDTLTPAIMNRKHRKKWIRNIAIQQIKRLFELAESISEARPPMADRYVHIVRRIGMRHRVRIPVHLKRRMCKHCGKYLVPGRTCRVRLNGTCVVVTCLACGKQTRRPYHHDRNHTPDKERE